MRRFLVLFSAFLLAVPVVFSAAPSTAADLLFISDEVADDPASGCQADNTGPSGAVLRTATDALNDAWLGAAGSAGYGAVEEAILPSAGSHANPISISFPFASGTRTATVTAVNVDSPASGSGDQGGTITGNITVSTGPTLQDCSPKPAHIYDVGGPHWTEGIGSGSSLNGTLFEFDSPVRAFGAWFGDLETRPEAEGGVSAIVKLFDSAGSELVFSTIDTSTPDTSVCGGPNSSDSPGCGNNTTRWIGFVRDAPDVAAMLVIVGSDDTATTGGDPGGHSEHISWAGAQLALAPAALVVDKTADVSEADIGDTIEYTIAVSNTGDEPATNVTIVDTPDSSLTVNPGSGTLNVGTITWTIPSLAGGAGSGVTYSGTVASFDQAGYGNSVSVTSDTTGAVEDSVLVASLYADLSVIKQTVNAPSAGEDIVYEIVVSNDSDAGGAYATGVTVTEVPNAPLTGASGPGWTCDLLVDPVTCTLDAPLPVGATAPTLTVTVATASDSDSSITNIASVTSDFPDPDGANNSAEVLSTVTTTTTTTTTTTMAPTTTSTIPQSSTTTTTATGDTLPATGLSDHLGVAGLVFLGIGVVALSAVRFWPIRGRTRH